MFKTGWNTAIDKTTINCIHGPIVSSTSTIRDVGRGSKEHDTGFIWQIMSVKRERDNQNSQSEYKDYSNWQQTSKCIIFISKLNNCKWLIFLLSCSWTLKKSSFVKGWFSSILTMDSIHSVSRLNKKKNICQ